MRTIKFRGKRNHSGEWHYGHYTQGAFFHPATEDETVRHLIHADILYDVDPETVGQFTGLYDKDGKEIYEGDILCRKDGGALLTVEFRHGAFGYEYCGEFHSWAGNHNFTFNPFDTDVDFGIIGNIHDNPELLTNK